VPFCPLKKESRTAYWKLAHGKMGSTQTPGFCCEFVKSSLTESQSELIYKHFRGVVERSEKQILQTTGTTKILRNATKYQNTAGNGKYCRNTGENTVDNAKYYRILFSNPERIIYDSTFEVFCEKMEFSFLSRQKWPSAALRLTFGGIIEFFAAPP